MRYARQMSDRHEARYIGHNLLGGWMVVVLLSCVALTSLTGYLFTTDLLWGHDWLADLHIALSWSMVGLVALHLLGVIMTSYRHRENLVRAMIAGIKTAPAGDDVM
nr:cytochrome b/b6 domain-containing protein [Undibacterium sp. TS12]